MSEQFDTIDQRLRECRKNIEVPLQRVADHTGLSVSFLSDLERGRTMPSLKTLARLATFYGYTLSELLEDVIVE